MLIIVVYDIHGTKSEDKKRASKISTICSNYGVRVQLSVFECDISYDQYQQMKIQIGKIIVENIDFVFFYRISHSWKRKIERLGNRNIMNIFDDNFII